MNNRIENAISNAVNCAPVIPFEELVKMPYIRLSEQDYITRQENRANTAFIKSFALAAAICLVLLVPFTGWIYQNRVSDSVIMLDINPSIEIKTNHQNKVLSVVALNDDAREIIGDNKFKDTKLEATVSVLIDSLVDKSYINTEKNTILLSVMNRNKKKADTILASMDTTITDNLKAKNIKPTIMSQIIAKETDRSRLAHQYHISEGRMKLILDMVSKDATLSIDTLAGMSLEQLFNLAKKNSIDLSDYNITENNEDNNSNANQKPTLEDNTGTQDNNKTTEDNTGKKEKNIITQDDQGNSENALQQDNQNNDSQDEDNNAQNSGKREGHKKVDQHKAEKKSVRKEDQQGNNHRADGNHDDGNNDVKIVGNNDENDSGGYGEGDQDYHDGGSDEGSNHKGSGLKEPRDQGSSFEGNGDKESGENGNQGAEAGWEASQGDNSQDGN